MNITATSQSLRLFGKFFDAKTATPPAIDHICPKEPFPIRPSARPLPVAAPESVGVSSGYIENFIKELAENDDVNLHDIIILRNGKIICKTAIGAQNIDVPKYTFSACKSIVSLAVGILVDYGVIDLDEKISDIFDKEYPQMSKIRSRQMTVEHLLTMQSGLAFSEFETLTQEDWLAGCLGSGLRAEPGREFIYNSLNTYLLSVIICRRTNMSLSEFMEKHLFSRLGIEDWYWETCPKGIEKGGWGLYLRPEDMAKLGLLVLNGGVWEGERIISEEYIDRATTVKALVPDSYGDFNYGYHIWVGRDTDSFLFNGMLGQNMLGFRDSGILIVANAGEAGSFQQGDYFKIVNKYFGNVIFPTTLPENKTGEESLKNYLSSLSAYNRERKRPGKAQLEPFVGKRFIAADEKCHSAGLMPGLMQLLQNNFTSGVESVSVEKTAGNLKLIYSEADETNILTVGLKKPELNVLSFKNQKYLAAVMGRVTHDDEENPVLRVEIDFIETPFKRVLKLVVKDGNMVLKQSETPGREYIMRGMHGAATTHPDRRLLSAVLGTIDLDFTEFKVDRVFSPEMRFVPEQDN